eukprot:10524668-Lingulodinium_polyedra.AAC.1
MAVPSVSHTMRRRQEATGRGPRAASRATQAVPRPGRCLGALPPTRRGPGGQGPTPPRGGKG